MHLPAKAPGPISAIAAAPDGETLAYACGAQVFLTATDQDQPRTLRALTTVTGLAFSPDGQTLAVTHEAGLSRWSLTDPESGPLNTPMSGLPINVTWRSDGAWLTCCFEADGFGLINAATNTAHAQGNFPAPVRSAAFGDPTNTVAASGAFRVAAWSLDDHADIKSGKAGLVLINAIATSPTRNLVAVGYANGLLSLAEIGRPSEILLREDTGAGITAMAWSHNGNYLALAGADGSVALVEFPDSMFKS